MVHDIEFGRVTKLFLGHCKTCKATVRVEPRRDGKVYVLPSGARSEFSRLSKHGVSFARFHAVCLCGSHVEFKQIVAWPSKKECNGTCMSAKGCSCDCSCGGKNHGAGHAVEIEAVLS